MAKSKLDYGYGYNENNSIAIIWEIEDVRSVLRDNDEFHCLDLSDDDCLDILGWVDRKHDATLGVTWETIYYAIEYHYDEEIQKAKEEIREPEAS